MDIKILLTMKIKRRIIYRSTIFSRNFEAIGKSLNNIGTKYHDNNSGSVGAIYLGNCLATRKSSKVLLVLSLKILNKRIIIFLDKISSK
jgi:hypothetical protein